jgi:sirohydrochlorin ferrochelatase
MTGIVLFAHGSTVQSANDGVRGVADELARRTGRTVEAAFLECAPPTLADAVAKLSDSGVRRIVIVPYFLTMGIHLKRDLPRIAGELRNIYEGVSIEIGDPLDGHPGLIDILVDRSKEALGDVRQTD